MEYLKKVTAAKNKSDWDKLNSVITERQSWIQRKSAQKYLQILQILPTLPHGSLLLDDHGVNIQSLKALGNDEKDLIESLAKELIPWRKGPFNLFDLEIDAEWRSDFKWNRIAPFLDDPQGKNILDIGCNNGHFMFQISKHLPRIVLGIDPVLHYWTQFHFLKALSLREELFFELLGIEHVHFFQEVFDIVLCMGIIYHHRHPLLQLQSIKDALRPSGQLILETIGIPGNDSVCLFPQDRYANMKNVWFIPTLECLVNWVKKAHFVDIKIISDTPLTPDEQRLTPWCPPPHQSLEDFLDPNDRTKTIEGHLAPRRFALSARKK